MEKEGGSPSFPHTSFFPHHPTNTMSLDHIMIKVKSWPKAKEYFEVALAPIGYVLLKDGGTWGGFHVPGKASGQIYVKQG